ncbi:lipoyl domain-containing protein [Microbacterium sp. BWT-B31]|uniref:lipoyl domain-containing protein n=1 Tax=Microbacterium sp. BWT-B31 TaxID=3232072 RepID=UPI003529017F
MDVKLTKDFLGDEEDADLVEWLIDDGATITEGQEIAMIETSKVVTELTAPIGGVISLKKQAGELVELDETIATIQ